jgi:hypothetical protein
VLGLRARPPLRRRSGAGPSDDGHWVLDGAPTTLPLQPDSPWTLGGAGALIVVAGLAGMLCSRGEPRPATADSVAADSAAVDTATVDTAAVDSAAVDSAAADSAPPVGTPADTPVSRPPIMDPAPKSRPPRLPRPDTAGSGA